MQMLSVRVEAFFYCPFEWQNNCIKVNNWKFIFAVGGGRMALLWNVGSIQIAAG